METKYTKKENSTLVVQEVIPAQVIPEKLKEPVEYSYEFLKNQKVDIQKQWDEMIAQKNKEIEEINSARQKEMDFVDELLKKADELGVVAKEEVEPVEEVLQEADKII
jgi:hypothetical protein